MVSLVTPNVALSSPRSACAIQARMDLGSISNWRPAYATLRFCSVTSLMASFLNSSDNKRRGIRFMETPNKLIKYHQLALPKKRVKLISIWERIVDKETGEVIFSFSILTINADGHEVIMHFHRTMDEKRSIVVLKDAEYQY